MVKGEEAVTLGMSVAQLSGSIEAVKGALVGSVGLLERKVAENRGRLDPVALAQLDRLGPALNSLLEEIHDHAKATAELARRLGHGLKP